MSTVFNLDDRLTLARRIDALPLDASPRWGRMDCPQMLAHLSDGVRMALGELIITTRGPRPLRLRPIAHAVIHWLPFPKSAPTAPELLVRRATDCRAECADLKHLLERLAAMEGARDWPEHPAFGRLNSRDWGTLVHRHVDHHLRQFGA
ncbi:MAG TPA: DUF1569 domain-containing protein [Vicinamibacterales bacterium]|nr:DUF1569 domain-containing protein [Vicinamibacterales bacterium]